MLIIAVGVSFACGTQSAPDMASTPPSVVKEVPTPTPEDDFLKVPVKTAQPLTRRQKKDLDSTLPPKVREILEKAEVLEVLGLSSDENAGISWHPDLVANLPLGKERTKLLNSFFYDASAGPNPSGCFVPRHGLKASYKGKTVEVIICYQCHLFVVKGDLGEFDGGVYKDGSAAHDLFENIIRTKGEPIK